ncbi:MAG: pyridoxal-phosphate dependent enzyme [Bacteroidales bacterium]|nr:pyridoxal-phosphate dependent enzyme [Bacteroidales bacterium]
MSLIIPTYQDIRETHTRIRGLIHRTPVLSSSGINTIAGSTLYFKCENFQKTGAFKYRGATNAVSLLTEPEASKGVATHSSGNHAAALACASQIRNIPCYIAMPRTAPKNKISAVRSYGGIITFCNPTLRDREETLERILSITDASFVHPYDNFNVICGQATAAKELLEDHPDTEALFVPVGGGGILSGSAVSAKSLNDKIKVYGCEPANADDAYRSLKKGRIIPSVNPVTIADGLLTSLSELTFEIIRNHVEEILTVSEHDIVTAMKIIWERMKIIIEPSAAVAFAAVLNNPRLVHGIKAGVILTGGNTDLLNLPFAQT